MPGAQPCILTLNGGSSSMKFALYSAEAEPRRLMSGQVQRIAKTLRCWAARDQWRRADLFQPPHPARRRGALAWR
jgi:acetate kinase